METFFLSISPSQKSLGLVGGIDGGSAEYVSCPFVSTIIKCQLVPVIALRFFCVSFLFLFDLCTSPNRHHPYFLITIITIIINLELLFEEARRKVASEQYRVVIR